MIDPAQLLVNVLADAFAHHEADNPAESIVRLDDVDGEGSLVRQPFLDWQLAGRVASDALELCGATDDGRPLFTIPAGLTPPPSSARGASADSSEEPADAISPHGYLAAHVLAVARDLSDVQAARHQFVIREIQRFRPGQTVVLGDLQRLTAMQLQTILERLTGLRRRNELTELPSGVYDSDTERARRAFDSLRAHAATNTSEADG